MATQFKNKKPWETNEEHQMLSPIETEFKSYSFLRNIWGTYFHDRDNAHCDDKIDHLNKIVGMMKVQVKMMTMNQNKVAESLYFERDKQEIAMVSRMTAEHERTREALERITMKQEQLLAYINMQGEKITSLQTQNSVLRQQLKEAKNSKNQMSERVIELTRQVYELERTKEPLLQESSLELYSAISAERQETTIQNNKLTLGRKESASVFQMCQQTKSQHSDEDKQNQSANVQKLNLDFGRNHMKQSLKCYYNNEQASQRHPDPFLEEMQRIRQKTSRIMETSQQIKLHKVRKTMAQTQRHYVQPEEKDRQEKRFKRIR